MPLRNKKPKRRTRLERAHAAARHRLLRQYRASVRQPWGVIFGLDPPYTISIGRQMALDDWNAQADLTNAVLALSWATNTGTARSTARGSASDEWGSGGGWTFSDDWPIPTGDWTFGLIAREGEWGSGVHYDVPSA
ncbi:hypothetical protein B0H11DRAFT_2263936 [Mycena galericulata]|nr:hypothetical protein B0H11DRAFT_2263936 [Mycena galericulata]